MYVEVDLNESVGLLLGQLGIHPNFSQDLDLLLPTKNLHPGIVF